MKNFKKIILKKKTYCRFGLQIIWGLAGVVVLTASGVQAEPVSGSSPWEIDADRIFRFTNPDVVVAEGNVVMTRKGEGFADAMLLPAQTEDDSVSTITGPKPLVIKGDWVRFDPVENVVTVRGNSSLDSEDEQIKASAVVLDLDDHTGTLTEASLYFPKRKLLLAGETVEKTGEMTYHLEDGWATKCEPRPDSSAPWSFGWQKASITAGGFAHFKHATFRVKDLPLVYTPYFAFSTNRERKTGLLLPEFSHSGRDGMGVLAPLFLNLSPSYDMTLYGGHLTNRGNQVGAELRYALDENSKATFALNYLQDRLDDSEDDYKQDGIYRTTKNRYWFRGKLDHDFGNNLLSKLDFDLVSDRDYLQEFQDGRIGYDESAKRFKKAFNRSFESETTTVRPNIAQLSKSWYDYSLNSELRTVNDPTDTASTSHLWSLPKVTFAGRLPVFEQNSARSWFAGVVTDVDMAWDSEYIYYWREDGVGSQRLDLHPKLISPLNLTPYLETTVSIGLRETLYLVDDNSQTKVGYDSGVLDRTMQDYNFTTSTIFMRDFGVKFQAFDQLTHMVRPKISYDYIPTNPHNQLPNLDATDRIAAKNLVTYEIRNDFDLFGRQSDGIESTRKFSFFNLSQSYDISEDRKTLTSAADNRRPLSAINFDMGVYPVEALQLSYKSDLDIYGRGFTKYEVQSRYSGIEDYNLGLEYRYEKDVAVNQLNANVLATLTDTLSLKGGVQHSFEIDKTTEASLGLFYKPECWALELLASTTPDDDYRFHIIFSLEGIGKVGGLSQTFGQGTSD